MDKQIPALETLKSIPQWVCYKNEIPKDGDKPAKMPKSPHTGRNAASTRGNDWSDFKTAVLAKKRYNMDGLGWVFTKEVGIIGIDLDHCIDDNGVISPKAQNIIASIHSYTEISPSGHGIHIFIYGVIPKSLGPAPDSGVEIYSHGRYFTMTGKHLDNTPETIATRQGGIEALWEAESKRRRDNKRAKSGSDMPKPVSNNTVYSCANMDAYTEKAYLDEINNLAMSTEGNRNHTLNNTAFVLGQFVGAGHLSRSEVENTLLSVAVQVGLSESEARGTINSGLDGGLSKPRSKFGDDKRYNGATKKVEPDNEPPKQMPPLIPLPLDIDLTYHENVHDHLDYIRQHWGLVPETITEFKVGYCAACPTSTYSASFTTPYYRNDNLIDIRHRLLSPNGNGTYRPEIEGQRPHLFNTEAVTGDDWAILVKQEFQTMLLHQNFLPAIGLPSVFRREWLDELSGLKRVFIALGPGFDKTARKIGSLLSQSGIEARISSLPFSPSDMLVKYDCGIGDFCKFIDQSWVV